MVMMRAVAVVLCLVLCAPGCAASRAHRSGGPPPQPGRAATDVDLMAGYIRQLPVGSKIRVTLASGRTVRATLMKHDVDPIVVQRRTRVPEPPFEIPVREILALELETQNGSPARTIAAGAAAAAGVTLGVLLILAAIFSD
jgi:hypothetical protein